MIIKLKDLLLTELTFSPGSLSSDDTQLRPWIVETHKDWFLKRNSTDYSKKYAEARVTINENNKKDVLDIKIVTHNLRKPNDSHSMYEERVDKFVHKIAKSWSSAAKKLHNNPKEITECGNKTMRSWKECFEEALNDSKISGYIQKGEPIVDPVNFSYVN